MKKLIFVTVLDDRDDNDKDLTGDEKGKKRVRIVANFWNAKRMMFATNCDYDDPHDNDERKKLDARNIMNFICCSLSTIQRLSQPL